MHLAAVKGRDSYVVATLQMMRMHKAKEEGWRSLLSSHDSDDSNVSSVSTHDCVSVVCQLTIVCQ